MNKFADVAAVEARPQTNYRTFLTGIGVSAALVAAVATAFLGLGAYVAFHGWPGGASANQAGSSVYVGNGEASNVASRAAAKALGGAPASVTPGGLPSAALIAAAGGKALPNPTGGKHHHGGRGHHGGGGSGGGGGGPQPPPVASPLVVAENMIDGTSNPGGGTIGDTGLTKPVWSLLDTTIGVVGGVAGTAGGVVGGLLGGTQSSSSQSGGLLSGLLGH